jgi:D-alanyl-D-alanine carboxypeptidase
MTVIGRATTLAVIVTLCAGTSSAATAGPALLFDQADGRVLFADDADSAWHPASLTKIMTAYMTFEAIKAGKLTLESKITVSEFAHTQPPSKIGLPVGAEMTVDMALKALIIKSANDVAVMLGEAISGSHDAFVEQMNVTAQRLGMSRTRFANANGLPAPEQVTTARDLARLSRAVILAYPQYGPLWAMGDMQIGRRRLRTHNALLRTYDGADGLKTGFTCDSGFNVVATATRDNRRLVAVVLGETSGRDRAVRAASLLEHGFQTSAWKQIFNTMTIETMPLGETTAPASVRDNVMSWDCGRRNRAAARAIAKSQTKRRTVAKQAETTIPPSGTTVVPAAKGQAPATVLPQGSAATPPPQKARPTP